MMNIIACTVQLNGRAATPTKVLVGKNQIVSVQSVVLCQNNLLKHHLHIRGLKDNTKESNVFKNEKKMFHLAGKGSTKYLAQIFFTSEIASMSVT